MGRRVEALAYQLRKLYYRILTAKPSATIIALILVATVIFLLGGGIYDLIEQPLLVFPMRGRWIFFYPYTIYEQTVVDSLVAMTVYGIGVAGLLLIYQSTKYAYKPRQALIMLLIGIAFIVLAFLYFENMLLMKMRMAM